MMQRVTNVRYRQVRSQPRGPCRSLRLSRHLSWLLSQRPPKWPRRRPPKPLIGRQPLLRPPLHPQPQPSPRPLQSRHRHRNPCPHARQHQETRPRQARSREQQGAQQTNVAVQTPAATAAWAVKSGTQHHSRLHRDGCREKRSRRSDRLIATRAKRRVPKDTLIHRFQMLPRVNMRRQWCRNRRQ